MELLHKELTEEVINAFYDVYNELGYGFLESVYLNALAQELTTRGFQVEVQKGIQVFYLKRLVGQYFADILFENAVIIEVKATETLCEAHEFQLVNYLKATETEVGLLLNFGKKPECKRKVFSKVKMNTDDADFYD